MLSTLHPRLTHASVCVKGSSDEYESALYKSISFWSVLKCHILKNSCPTVLKTGPTSLSNPATFFHFLHNGNIWHIMCCLFCVFTPLEVNFTGSYFITRAAEALGSLLHVCSECEHSAEWTGYATCTQTQHLKKLWVSASRTRHGVSCR